MPFSENTADRSTPTGNPYELFTPPQGLTAEDYQLHGDPTSDRSEQDLSSEQPAALSFYQPQQDVQRDLYQSLHGNPTFFAIPGRIPEANNPNGPLAGIEDWAFNYDPLTGAYEDPPSEYNQPLHGDPTFFEHTPAGGPYEQLARVGDGVFNYDPLTDAYEDPTFESNQPHGDPTFFEHTPAGGPYDPLTAAYEVTIAQYDQAHGDQTSSLSGQDSSSGLPAALSFYLQPEAQNTHYQPLHGDPTSGRSGPGSSSNITFRPQNAAPHNLELPQEGQGSSSNPELKLSADAQQAEATARADNTRQVQEMRKRGTRLRDYVNNHLRQLDLKQGTEGKEYPYIPTSRTNTDKKRVEFRTIETVLEEVPKMLQARRDLGMQNVPDLTDLIKAQAKALRKKKGDDNQSNDSKQRSRERAAELRKYINDHHLLPHDQLQRQLDQQQGKPGTEYPYLTTWGVNAQRLQSPGAVLEAVPNVLQARRDLGMKNVPNLDYLLKDKKKALRKAKEFEEKGDRYVSDGE
ncbi:hypothetical protein [Dictyobacter arantiisoli]|uniref:Uncharacterized protein n=1 Tax=Dictyobacter arantiisoli TaxID=2014874 RepID=A0A5A5TL09_9CHLR|nr:hypothetical protein [Dictyobacter arantiisoli]GCF11948.1 hypothetical protein KDI_55120 [Dictyobacter arantiisoli]